MIPAECAQTNSIMLKSCTDSAQEKVNNIHGVRSRKGLILYSIWFYTENKVELPFKLV